MRLYECPSAPPADAEPGNGEPLQQLAKDQHDSRLRSTGGAIFTSGSSREHRYLLIVNLGLQRAKIATVGVSQQ
jgi:hypothetical protein